MQKINTSTWIVSILLFVSAATLGIAVRDYDLFGISSGELLPPTTNDLGFFVLINLNIILLMVLGYLVAKNVIKLILDRRNKILGSKLRTRIVTAFVSLSLVPTLLLFFVAVGILESVLQGWFSPKIMGSLDGALRVSKYHFTEIERKTYRGTKYISSELAGVFYKNSFDRQFLLKYLDKKRKEYGLHEVTILNREESVLLSSKRETDAKINASSFYNTNALAHARKGEIFIQTEQEEQKEVVRGYALINNAEELNDSKTASKNLQTQALENYDNFNTYLQKPIFLVTASYINPRLSKSLLKVLDAHADYKQLRTYRRPLASSYLLTLGVVAILVIFTAIWIGFYLARGLTEPIQSLAQGTDQIAHGNLDYAIPEIGDDELGVLVKSFNKMTHDLKETTGELVSRRNYMEAVLASLGVGVISVDENSNIRTINTAATEIFGLEKIESSSPSLSSVLSEQASKKFTEVLEELSNSGEKLVTDNLTLQIKDRTKHIHITVTTILGRNGRAAGAVFLVDDVTELVSAQRMAAWREVARRIAHEIKNPLTPIQLSAQRIRKRFVETPSIEESGALLSTSTILSSSDKSLIVDCTDVIVGQIESMRVLVNEFSRFARMPKIELRSVELGALLQELVKIYKDRETEIIFSLELSDPVLNLEIDREQFQRALINILDNAVSSVRTAKASEGSNYLAAISISMNFNHTLNIVNLTIADNGFGISDEDKPKVFEPYFSTRKGGTGLGLAIVNSIISDHNGFIRVHDNLPRGAKFVIELPCNRVNS